LDDGYLCDAAPNVALTVVIEIADATAIVAEELVPVVAFPVEHAVQQIIHAGRVCLRRRSGEPEKRRGFPSSWRAVHRSLRFPDL
jgi:hypothetical protein